MTAEDADDEGITCCCAGAGLDYDWPQDFAVPMSGERSMCYVIYRWGVSLVLLTYFLFDILVVDDPELHPRCAVQLSCWGYSVLCICVTCQAIIAIDMRTYSHEGGKMETPTFYKVFWVLYNINLNLAPAVTITFLITTPDSSSRLHHPSILIMNVVNSVYVLVDFFIQRVPVRLLHVFHALLVAAAYAGFTFIYWAAGGQGKDHGYLYRVIDYSDDMVSSSIWVGAFLAYFIVQHVVWYLLYLFKMAAFRAIQYCCQPSEEKTKLVQKSTDKR